MNYIEFIALATTRGYLKQIQWVYDTATGVPRYYLRFWDGPECYACFITDDPSILDFETKYKGNANGKILAIPIESTTGWMKTRSRSTAGDLKLTYIYFTTGDENSLDCGDATEYSITVSDAFTDLKGNIRKMTHIDFMPSYSYELGGGGLCIRGDLTGKNLKLSFIAAPDIPSEYGGSVKFIDNKQFNDSVKRYDLVADAKFFRYVHATPVANKVRVCCTHGVNDHIECELYLTLSIGF